MSVVNVTDVEAALDKTAALTADDAEIQRLIDEAEAFYAEWVGPLPSEVPETFDGGTDHLILSSSNASAITAASYADGTTIDTDDLTVSNGIVYWGYGTAGYFNWGTRNVTITYTAGALPAHHKGAIIEDVANHFRRLHRGALGLLDESGVPQPVDPLVSPAGKYANILALRSSSGIA